MQEVSKSSIEDLFKDLLKETKCFKDQITLAVLLSKIKTDGILNIHLLISIQQLKR